MNKRKRIAIVAGGFSGESIVSLKSAETILKHIDKEIFEPFLVKVLESGWTVEWKAQELPVNKEDFSFNYENDKVQFDFAFIIIHGTPGEDGILQAYFDLIEMPYSTGDSTLMGLTFDKAYTQNVLKGLGFNVARNSVVQKGMEIQAKEICSDLGLPCFVKPSRAGSSLGVSKVKSWEELDSALNKAFSEHPTALIEEFLDGIEITCGAYLKNGEIIALPVTEIVSQNEFFDFEAKYNDESTEEITPARISADDFLNCQAVTKKVYQQLSCKGIVRVDYMLVGRELYIIELNTVPGMSAESIVPKQLAAAEIDIKLFISDLILGKIKNQEPAHS